MRKSLTHRNVQCHRYKTKPQVHDANLLNHTQASKAIKWPGKEVITFVLSCYSCLT